MTSPGAELRLECLAKTYGGLRALDDLSLSIAPGCFQALLGPSGSGKTSVLMSVAGFLTLDSGRILVNGQDISRRKPEARNFGMVFQGYALFPHLSVLDNVAFSLRARGVAKAERNRRAGEAIDMVRLSGLEARLPRELSGGQQQRVALARAIAFQPDLLLLDEPLSALDRQLRGDLQSELRALQRKTGLTCLYVTHDQDEALSMADAVAVMKGGRIIQSGTPHALYERPQTEFVASFLGKSNFLEASVLARLSDHAVCALGTCRFTHAAAVRGTDADILLALRPEKLRVLTGPPPEGFNTAQARITSITYLGASVEIEADAFDLGRILIHAQAAETKAAPGETVTLAWPPSATVEVTRDRMN